MSDPGNITVEVAAKAQLPGASLQVVKFTIHQGSTNVRHESELYRLDLCLSPRAKNSKACYPRRWNRNRFERIGNAFVLPPGEVVETKSDPAVAQKAIICSLRPEPICEWLEGDLVWTDRRLESTLDIRSDNLRTLLLRTATELQSPGLASQVLLGLLVGRIAVELGRYCTTVSESATKSGLATWRLQRINERLEEVAIAPTLHELAQLCGMSVRTLTRSFRASIGVSIGQYVADKQLLRAKRLLTSGASVAETAETLGFASSAAFGYAFRRATGETPGQFREQRVTH